MTDEILKAIEASAELVAETLGVGFDEDGIQAIDAFIDRLMDKYKESDEEFKTSIVFRVGSFLGEAIIENYGGRWIEDEGNFAIGFDSDNSKKNIAYVFSKVVKQFENGAEDSVMSFYHQIPKVLKGDLLKK